MSRDISKLQNEIQALSVEEKAKLACEILNTLDEGDDGDVEQLWLDEARKRFDAYRMGDIESRPAAEVFARIRARLSR